MKLFSRNGRSSKSNNHINLYPQGAQHPDLPLSPNLRAPSPRSDSKSVNRSSSLSERFGSGQARDRRSLAIDPGSDPSLPFSPEDYELEAEQLSTGPTRSQTLSRREGSYIGEDNSVVPSPVRSPDPQHPSSSENSGLQSQEYFEHSDASMNQLQAVAPGKASTDSGQSTAALDRFTQRRLQRLNTEQGFREQRQGGHSIYSPPSSFIEKDYTSANNSYVGQESPKYNQQLQPHPSQPAYQSDRGIPTNANVSAAAAIQPASSASRPNNYQPQNAAPVYALSKQQNSPDDTNRPRVSAEDFRPGLPQQSRSYQQQQSSAEDTVTSMSSVNNGNLQAPKNSRIGGPNRQSVHSGMNPRDASQPHSNHPASGVSNFNAPSAPSSGQNQTYQHTSQQPHNDIGRKTPQPLQTSEDMTDEEINQLIKDHKELREKYTKVKKYYFEKEDQVKQLQNSLAHQRLSQSRTSLDDSEYTTRFNRLDGLIAQLAFSIRKSWSSIPPWLAGSVNKDAIATGKQEMTAAGRALISSWLVEEVFDRYFHPDLDPILSQQLKGIQKNIRYFAPLAQTAEEEEYLTSKIVNWRLSTLEGLQDALRSKECSTHRAQLTDSLKQSLVSDLAKHLHEPPPADLEGGVHMIIELVVSIAIHLPLESRDVVIDYWSPGASLLNDQMKMETGIPPLTTSVAEDAAELVSNKEEDSDPEDNADSTHSEQPSKKRSMLRALTGKSAGGSHDQRKHGDANGSSNSPDRPDSSQGARKDGMPRVRMAAGLGVQIRGRSVLIKAPVFTTQ